MTYNVFGGTLASTRLHYLIQQRTCSVLPAWLVFIWWKRPQVWLLTVPLWC